MGLSSPPDLLTGNPASDSVRRRMIVGRHARPRDPVAKARPGGVITVLALWWTLLANSPEPRRGWP
jgi:hypothetical protein